MNHKIKFSIITQKFPGGPFTFQEISRRVFKFQEISRSCRHPEYSPRIRRLMEEYKDKISASQ